MRMNSSPARTAWAAASVLVLLLAGCGGGGSEGSADTVRFGAFRTLSGVGVETADDKGYFEDQGIEVESVFSDSVPATLQAVASGDIDVATSVPAVFFAAMQNGTCVKALRPMEGVEYNIIAQKSLGVDMSLSYPDSIKQLKGKVIGVPARGGGPETVIRKFMVEAGLNPDTDASFVAVGIGAAATTAFSSGKVDVMMATGQLEAILSEGEGYDVLMPILGQKDGPLADYYMTMLVVGCDYAEEYPETVQKFCDAVNLGYEALIDDPEAGPKALVELQVAPDLEAASSLWEKYKDPMTEIPVLDEETWAFQGEFAPEGVDLPEYRSTVVDGCSPA